jgi:hypothetical protein
MSQQQQQQQQQQEYQSNYTMSYPSNNKLDPSTSIVYPTSTFYPMSTSPSYTYYENNQPFISNNTKPSTCSPSSIMIQDPPMLVASSSSTTTASTMSSSSVELLNEAFAKATSLPESFYPEFLQYSKESYEQSTGGGPNRKKQKRSNTKDSMDEPTEMKFTESDDEP